jgi:hypothetical protein
MITAIHYPSLINLLLFYYIPMNDCLSLATSGGGIRATYGSKLILDNINIEQFDNWFCVSGSCWCQYLFNRGMINSYFHQYEVDGVQLGPYVDSWFFDTRTIWEIWESAVVTEYKNYTLSQGSGDYLMNSWMCFREDVDINPRFLLMKYANSTSYNIQLPNSMDYWFNSNDLDTIITLVSSAFLIIDDVLPSYETPVIHGTNLRLKDAGIYSNCPLNISCSFDSKIIAFDFSNNVGLWDELNSETHHKINYSIHINNGCYHAIGTMGDCDILFIPFTNVVGDHLVKQVPTVYDIVYPRLLIQSDKLVYDQYLEMIVRCKDIINKWIEFE